MKERGADVVQACSEVTELLDSYLSDELSVESNHVVARHADRCAACAAALRLRRRVRDALQAALATPPASPDLERRIRHAVGIEASGRRGRRQIMLGLAASLVLGLTATLFVLRRPPERPPLSLRAQIEAQGALPANIGLYESASLIHQICAVHRKPPAPPSFDLVAARLGPHGGVWAALEPALSGATLVDAHLCPPRGPRQYGHVILRRGPRVLSILVTGGQPGDRLSEEAVALRVAGLTGPAYETQRTGYEIEALSAGDQVGLLVSQAGETADRAFLLGLMPQLARVLRLETPGVS
jgi:Putative zinc-finger